MSDGKTYRFSEAEARRMRRGALLFPILVLPFAAIFALDSSKSQPAHFVLVMSIAVLISTIFVCIAWAGANAQIRSARASSLTITADRLVWDSSYGRTERLLSEIASVSAERRRSHIASIKVSWLDGSITRLEAYECMDEILASISTNAGSN